MFLCLANNEKSSSTPLQRFCTRTTLLQHTKTTHHHLIRNKLLFFIISGFSRTNSNFFLFYRSIGNYENTQASLRGFPFKIIIFVSKYTLHSFQFLSRLLHMKLACWVYSSFMWCARQIVQNLLLTRLK